MKKFKKIVSSPITTAVAFVLAAGLLLFSSIGGARAALTYFSEDYETNIQLHEIGITLLENGQPVEGEETLLKHLLEEDEVLKLGKAYPEELHVYNSGVINEYIRVNIHKYWLDENDEKIPELSPGLIDLHLVNLGTDWLLDENASTEERTVLYYNKLLNSETGTVPFADYLTIKGGVVSKVKETRQTSGIYTTITTTYEYDGARFCIEIKADGVQEHNAQDAIWSSWGRRVTVNNGALSLD